MKNAFWLYRLSFALLLILMFQIVPARAGVDAWYALGQVWVVWDVGPTDPATFKVYKSADIVDDVAQAELAGRLFPNEWRGSRLESAESGLTFSVPGPTGGHYQLSPSQGVFAYTPHAAGADYFYVLPDDAGEVTPANVSSQVAYSFDPVGDPVRPHLQAEIADGEFTHYVYTVWVDGRTDPDSGRPDFPIMASMAKNGSPHIFMVSSRNPAGSGTALPAANFLHGGGGHYWAWRPTSSGKMIMGLIPDEGISIAHDDVVVRLRPNGAVDEEHTWWFGYPADYDPFSIPPATPPDDAVLVDYTVRRINWINDWLVSTWNVDPDRISIIGHSMGGGGSFANARLEPTRYNSAVAFNPGYRGPQSAKAVSLLGSQEQNLATNRFDAMGNRVHANDIWGGASNISSSRDYPLIRIYAGRSDTSNAAGWGSDLVEWLRTLDEAAYGTHTFWDERTHSVAQWSGHWANQQTGVQTERDDVAYQDRYLASQSFPAFFGDDQNLTFSGRQPDPGLGTPVDGDLYGTWGGYFDWELETIVDTSERWEVTIFLVGTSANDVDNFPGESAVTSLAIRKPRTFHPEAGGTVDWIAEIDGQVVQSGQATVGEDGVVSIDGLSVPKVPLRLRLSFVASQPRVEIDDSDPSIRYVRGWHPKTAAGATAGSYHRRMSGDNGTSGHPEVALAFTGTRVNVLIGKSIRGGGSEVYLDGELVGGIDFNSFNDQPEFGYSVAFSASSTGDHELLIRHLHGAAYIDGFIIESGSPETTGLQDTTAQSMSLLIDVPDYLLPLHVSGPGEWISILLEGAGDESLQLVAPDGSVHYGSAVPVDSRMNEINVAAGEAGVWNVRAVGGPGARIDVDIR